MWLTSSSVMQHRFEYFEPLDGEPPQHRPSEFWEVLFRARNLLKGRNREEVLSGALILNEIRVSADFREPVFDLIEHWAPQAHRSPDGSVSEAMPTPDEVDGYVHNMGKIELSAWPQLPNAQWHELFAILALSYVEKMHQEERSQADGTLPAWMPRLDAAGLNERAYDYLAMANHALSVAEGLLNTRKVISERGRKAVKVHHEAKTGAIRAKVAEMYTATFSHLSNRKAADRIVQELTASETLKLVLPDRKSSAYKVFFQGKQVLETDDVEHRVETWIASIKKASKEKR